MAVFGSWLGMTRHDCTAPPLLGLLLKGLVHLPPRGELHYQVDPAQHVRGADGGMLIAQTVGRQEAPGDVTKGEQ